ncbi:hypothetical protein TNCV_4824611 [Trichonephila clavipes]|nr:hypothetical protein TNCV_4824611 [Trichonephila clavipes]
MALYRSPLTVTLWPSSFLEKYGPRIPPAHKAHQTDPPASMVAMTLGLKQIGFRFESRVRHDCIFFGKGVGLPPVMDSRLERKSSAALLIICWDHPLQ